MPDFKIFNEIESIKIDAVNIIEKTDARAQIEQMWNEKVKKKPPVSLIFYGVYNAGKSTLINALTGEDLADIGSTPTTRKIQSYPPWKDAVIFVDAPGKDAVTGSDFEEVSKENILEYDAILFVISADTQFEEKWIWEEIKELLKIKKPLFLILNEKQSLNENEEKRILEKISYQIQQLVGDECFFGPFPVNAKRGYDGKIEGDETKLELSGIPKLEESILNAVKKAKGMFQLRSLLSFIKETLKKELEEVHASLSEHSKPYEDVLRLLQSFQEEMTGWVERKLSEKRVHIEEIVKNKIEGITLFAPFNQFESGVENLQNELRETLSSTLEEVFSTCCDKLERCISDLKSGLEADFKILFSRKKEIPEELPFIPQNSKDAEKQQEISVHEALVKGKKSETLRSSSELPRVVLLQSLRNIPHEEASQAIRDILKLIKTRPPNISPQKFGKELTRLAKGWGRIFQISGWVASIGLEWWMTRRALMEIKKREKEEMKMRSKYCSYLLSSIKLQLDNLFDSAREYILRVIGERINELKENCVELAEKQKHEVREYVNREVKIDKLLNRIEAVWSVLGG